MGDGVSEKEAKRAIRKAWRRLKSDLHSCPRRDGVKRRLSSVVCVKCYQAAEDLVKAVHGWQQAAWEADRRERGLKVPT